MESVKDTKFYREAIQEINFSFGTFYLFDTYVIGEVNADVVFSWKKHGKIVTKEISNLYDNKGEGLVYITNRINSYSVMPSDWFYFYKYSYNLKGYAVVSYSEKGFANSVIEKVFTRNKYQSFNTLENAITWAKNLDKQLIAVV